MHSDPADELLSLLTYKLLGYTELNGTEPEASVIEFLVGVMTDYGMGDYTLAQVVRIFKEHPIPDFDILLWIQSKVASGQYAPDPDMT